MHPPRTMLIAILVIAVTLAGSSLHGQGSRPVKDDIGFCWDPEAMRRFVHFLEAESDRLDTGGTVIAAISPHDDYLYAGRIYAPVFRRIHTREVLIFGVTHASVRKEIGDPRGVLIFDTFESWKGLEREVRISPLRALLMAQLDTSMFIVSNKAHALEHSIEALIPFLQYYNPDAMITPIMVTAMPFERMDQIATQVARIVTGYIRERHLEPGRDLTILISSDANHYGPDFANAPYGVVAESHRRAVDLDRKLVDTHLTGQLTAGKIEALTGSLWGRTYTDPGSVVWCGKYSIPFGLLTVLHCFERPLEGVLLRYGDTYSGGVLPITGLGIGLTAPFSLKHWVGFCSVMFH